MSQQFLDYPDVVAVLKEMRDEGVPERMAGSGLRETRLPDGPVYGALHHRFEETRSSCDERRPSATHDGAPTRPLNQAASHAAVDIGGGSIGRVVHPGQEARGQEITHADELRSTPKRFSRGVA